jgi:hypothetical protein
MTDSPIACALEAGDFGRRLAAIAELNRTALRSSSRDDLTLELVYAKEALARVRDFVRREEECCAFLVFQIDEEGEAVRVTVRAPEDARIAAESLFEQFSAAAAPGGGCCA